MAEFKEIVDIFDRIHRKYNQNCMLCPLDGLNISQCRKLLLEDPVNYEPVILKWAKENPKPINWIEWLYKMGIFEDRIVCGNKHTCSLTEKAYNENVPEGIVLLSKELI